MTSGNCKKSYGKPFFATKSNPERLSNKRKRDSETDRLSNEPKLETESKPESKPKIQIIDLTQDDDDASFL